MKKPMMKTYIVQFTANSEKNERMFENVLEAWRKDGLILTWKKLETLKHKYGDE
jgi:hypothetical protein